MWWLDWVYYLLLAVVMLAGLFLNLLGLPGLWLMVGAHLVYGWATGWDHYVGLTSVIALLVLALTAEAVEFFAGAAGSKAAGGRKRGMAGAIVGGLIGGIALTGLMPIIGTIIGACAGAFIGAALMEYSDRDLGHSMNVGIGAAKGRLLGIVAKTAFGLLIAIIAMIAAIPIGSASGTMPPPPPATIPATMPATVPATMPTTGPVM